MSEYQYIAFRAVDRPLTDAELRFAREQSTRAEITRWSFSNEYHYGDFHGNVEGLLLAGYDVHLHYANFGTRRVALRLPGGIPFPKRVWKAYIDHVGIRWKGDKKGKGGILNCEPFHDAGCTDEVFDPGAYVEDCVGLRQRLIRGDLRALYVIWLCAAGGDDGDWGAIEPPVPMGMENFTDVAEGVLDFFGVDPLVLAAAAEGMPPLPAGYEVEETTSIAPWIDGLSDAEVRRRLLEFMTDDPTAVKAKLLAEYRDRSGQVAWPTVPGTRSYQHLQDRAEILRAEEETRRRAEREKKAKLAARAAERARKERMQEMVAAPEPWLAEAERLADARGTANYKAAASILADLRQAIGGDAGEKMAHQQAAYLAKKYPTLTHLKSSLRKQGLLP